jgi:hypothetical protein
MERVEAELQVLENDLFSEASWRLFGLSRGQLAKYGAAWGGIAGGAVDLMVGGLSFFAGAGIGASVGALSGWFGGTEVAKVWGERSKLAQALFPGDTGRFLSMGPVTSPRYAWMLLDRALLHLCAVRARAHARRDALELSTTSRDGEGVVQGLSTAARGAIDDALRSVLKDALAGGVSATARTALQSALATALDP